jgi:hypothetical protein
MNAPDMLLLTEALAWGWKLEEVETLSLGNGATPWAWALGDTVNPSSKDVLEITLDRAYRAPEATAVWQAKAFIGSRHTLIDPKLGQDYDIDDASKPTLDAEATIWNQAADGYFSP